MTTALSLFLAVIMYIWVREGGALARKAREGSKSVVWGGAVIILNIVFALQIYCWRFRKYYINKCTPSLNEIPFLFANCQ